MLARPDDLADDTLATALSHRWDVTVVWMEYRPVGFGSHHWEVIDPEANRWFVTVDELEAKRHSQDEPLDSAYARLRASLATAQHLRDHGATFVVAPLSTSDGEPLGRLGPRYAVALYPFIAGESYDWGEFSTSVHRGATLDLIIATHLAPAPLRRDARTDDFDIPHRDALEAALRGPDDAGSTGPYAERTARLVTEHAAPIGRLLARYDELVAAAQAQHSRAVLTHGEPHPGNTMLTTHGWVLVDWDTVLVAPPERDLWGLDQGDGAVLRAYAEATGVTPEPTMLELYRLRWDVVELAVDVSRFRRPHPGNADDEKTYDILCALVRQISA